MVENYFPLIQEENSNYKAQSPCAMFNYIRFQTISKVAFFLFFHLCYLLASNQTARPSRVSLTKRRKRQFPKLFLLLLSEFIATYIHCTYMFLSHILASELQSYQPPHLFNLLYNDLNNNYIQQLIYNALPFTYEYLKQYCFVYCNPNKSKYIDEMWSKNILYHIYYNKVSMYMHTLGVTIVYLYYF